MSTGFSIGSDEQKATGNAQTLPRVKRVIGVPTLTRLELLIHKFGTAPKDVMLRNVITDDRQETRP